MISVNGVSKSFAGKRQVTALEQIDLQVARGEMLPIVGPSGSGKSTLLEFESAAWTGPARARSASMGETLRAFPTTT
ncbi:MAG TPA: ATP-binding cassette domain-containing protein [Bryobacteraceae bacterium]|nr:ATP-binding cassette domain-containing protein [Bryobacteraceae bacterium]